MELRKMVFASSHQSTLSGSCAKNFTTFGRPRVGVKSPGRLYRLNPGKRRPGL